MLACEAGATQIKKTPKNNGIKKAAKKVQGPPTINVKMLTAFFSTAAGTATVEGACQHLAVLGCLLHSSMRRHFASSLPSLIFMPHVRCPYLSDLPEAQDRGTPNAVRQQRALGGWQLLPQQALTAGGAGVSRSGAVSGAPSGTQQASR